jgi:hypothetical protein
LGAVWTVGAAGTSRNRASDRLEVDSGGGGPKHVAFEPARPGLWVKARSAHNISTPTFRSETG